MKKTMALLLALIMVLSLTACGTEPADKDKKETNNEPSSIAPETEPNENPEDELPQTPPVDDTTEDTKQKLEGQITGASAFSEGYALVCVSGKKDTTYCIDKEGNVIYQLEENLVVGGTISQTIVNGRLLINNGTTNGIYDMTGKLTRPEDVGATRFYGVALKGGYILAEKVTADYSSTKKEIGVMNLNYEWVVEPSEEIYTAIEKDLSSLSAVYHDSYYHDGYIYCVRSKCYLNVTTGEVLADIDRNTPSEYWLYSTNGKYADSDQNIMLDLSHHANIKLVMSAKFKNGKAPVFFHNVEAGAWFFTLVDEQGNFQFEPVQVKDMPIVGYVNFDGQYLLIMDNMLSSNRMQCYNVQGELVGSYNERSGFTAELSDGVIIIRTGTNTNPRRSLHNPDFTPLF